MHDVIIGHEGFDHAITGQGVRPLPVFVDALNQTFAVGVSLVSCEEQPIGAGGPDATAAFVVLETRDGERVFGAGLSACGITASVSAVVSAVNRSIPRAEAER